MAKDDILGTLGAVLSWIATTASFLWSVGALQIVFSFLAGAFTTYLVQRRLQIESEKRKIKRQKAITLRNQVYGPIFVGLTEMLEKTKTVQHLDWELSESLKEVKNHYLYSTITKEQRDNFSEILDRFKKYESLRRATEIMLRDVIRKKILQRYKFDIDHNENLPHISLRIGKVHVAYDTMIYLILRDMKARDFIAKEEKRWGEDLVLEVVMGAKIEANLGDFESLYEHVLREAEKDKVYVEERKQRERLVNELEEFLEKIRVFVDFE